MKMLFLSLGVIAGLLVLTGCATSKPYDYTNYNAHPPRSIVVLPPLNESTDIRGTYGYLSMVTRPLAEMGYYVFPVVEVDELMKENGLPTAGEMNQVPLNKIGEIIGADAVLYIVISQYGSKYEVISSVTTVSAHAKLVDVKTGLTLWEGSTTIQQGSGGGNIIADLITAAVVQGINSETDPAHDIASTANYQLFTPKGRGLLYGPYHPKDKGQ
jgi:hypothetical protein